MTPTTISAIAGLRTGVTLDCIRGTFTKIYTDVKSGDNANGPWSFQNATFKDLNGDTIKVKFKNQDTVPQSWAGKLVEVVTVGGAKAKGIEVSEYNEKKELLLHPTVEFNWIQGDARQETRRPDPPDDRQSHREAPAQRQEPESRQTQRQEPPPGNVPIHGATVGMALNQASRILTESVAQPDRLNYFLSPKYLEDLWAVASGIVRVSQHMERGNLAKKAAAKQQEPAKETRPPADADQPHTW